MRYKVTYIIAASILVLTGCSREPVDSFLKPTGKAFVLTLDCGEMSVSTKASPTRDGVTVLKENAIGSTAHVYFFRKNLDSEPLKAQSLNVPVKVGGRLVVETSDALIRTIFGGLTNRLTCHIVVLTNHSAIDAEEGITTLGQLKASALSRHDWNDLPPEESFVMVGEQTLTLDWVDQTAATAEVHLKRIASKITLQITIEDQVTDPAGNIWTPQTSSMRANLLYVLKDAVLGGTPTPVPGDKNSPILDSYDTYRPLTALPDSTKKQLRADPNNNNALTPTDVQLYYIPATIGSNTCESAFYTYPAAIETGAFTEPYIKLIIPWKHGSSTRDYYYKIPFQHMQLLKNTWYRIIVDVQILGGDDDEKAPTLELKYSIADWSGKPAEGSANPNSSVLPGEIIAARYLNVNTKEYVLYNEDDLDIPIDSSHDIEIVGFSVRTASAYKDKTLSDGTPNPDVHKGEDPSVYNPFNTGNASLLAGPSNYEESWVGTVNIVRPNYKTTDGTPEPSTTTITNPADLREMFPTVTRQTIHFHHVLKRNMSAGEGGYDIAPYTILFRVRHQDDKTGYYSDIIIEQRPSILIEPQANSGTQNNYGYAFVNGSNGSNYGEGYYTHTSTNNGYNYYWNIWTYWLGSAPNGTGNSSNTNLNMYVIETSVLPSEGLLASYMLGDTRMSAVDNLNATGSATNEASWSHTEKYIDGNGTRKLKYYHPTDKSTYSDNFIAPKFRVASSYGATYQTTYDNAFRRCASYQEDGYPAGRWRVPTVAEISFIAQLTTDNLIPRLLGSSSMYSGITYDPYSEYWSNSGYCKVANGNSADWGGRVPAPIPMTDQSSSDMKSIRCVYDDWYWENTNYARITTANRGTFYWGDLQ